MVHICLQIRVSQHLKLSQRHEDPCYFNSKDDHFIDIVRFQVKWTAEKLQNEPFLFGDFLDLNVPSAERVYRPISDYEKLAHILEEYIVRVNYGGGQVGQHPLYYPHPLSP